MKPIEFYCVVLTRCSISVVRIQCLLFNLFFSGSDLNVGAYGAILAGVECTHGQYTLTISLLFLISDVIQVRLRCYRPFPCKTTNNIGIYKMLSIHLLIYCTAEEYL